MKIVKKPVDVIDIKKHHSCNKSDNHPNCQTKHSN